MQNLENKNIEIYRCKKCNTEIPFGEPYYSIGRTLEFMFINPDTKEEEIEIIEGEEIICLCKTCGSYFNMKGLEKILQYIPIPGQEIRN